MENLEQWVVGKSNREQRQLRLVVEARKLEQAAASCLTDIPEPGPILVGKRRGSTRAHEMDVLKERLTRLHGAYRDCKTHGVPVRKAFSLWNQMEGLLWELAMSSKRVANLEARRLTHRPSDEEDMRQEGYIGLMRAAKRFEPAQGVKFDTYARWWTRAEMTRAMEQKSRTIRIPAGAAEQLRLINKVQNEWDREGREYTLTDVAEVLHLERTRVTKLLSSGTTVSLESEVDAGPKARAISSLIKEVIIDDAETLATLKDQVERVMYILNDSLDPREREVLTLRYGLRDQEFRTLKEIGKILSISRERVRQIEIVAFEKIRKNELFREGTPRRRYPNAA